MNTVAVQLQQMLRQRVGAFFRNTIRVDGETCAVCTGPAAGALCPKCREHAAGFADRLADVVVILTYVRGRTVGSIHQSAHTVVTYKRQQPQPAPKCAKDMAMMIGVAEALHGRCIARAAGEPWSAVTFVPSDKRPGATHPLAALARQIQTNNESRNRLLLGIGPGFAAMPDRTVREDRFVVPAEYADRVRDRHVLLVEDTWTSGAKAQSAAVTLHDAGAKWVTVLCVARWCRDDWEDHKLLLDRCADPYDAMVCPVAGGDCLA
ncbi:hypothetical protein [Actinokineospora sp.]|uniref:hypothetical protein n=1 Tax=Actinokineospora sp. TaxID=1872133 RepID=UPI00403774B6